MPRVMDGHSEGLFIRFVSFSCPRVSRLASTCLSYLSRSRAGERENSVAVLPCDGRVDGAADDGAFLFIPI